MVCLENSLTKLVLRDGIHSHSVLDNFFFKTNKQEDKNNCEATNTDDVTSRCLKIKLILTMFGASVER